MESSQYWITRLIFQKALAGTYLLAFTIAFNQARPLIGEKGLLPIHKFLNYIKFWDAPSLFFINGSDAFLLTLSAIGIALALFALSGWSESLGLAVSMFTWASLWLLYLSFVNSGQVFYGFGWETLLLETGFLAIFFGSRNIAPPVLIIWLLRWVLFRIMFGAGMIKVRGDSCWRDLTCMIYHYETQPLPNPVSWYLHKLPAWFHKAEVAFTHFVEIIVPFGFFSPLPFRWIAGILTVLFQVSLIVSGNLSWLNYVTLVLCIACFDDAFFSKIFNFDVPTALEKVTWFHTGLISTLGAIIALLSIRPTLNLMSSRQMMNASFEPLHLVNTYGAFGSITRTRYEIILEGSSEGGPDAKWIPYEFKGKPGDPTRRPSIVSPYHYKLDWQMWFAAMSGYENHPWLVHLVKKLLENDSAILSLMGTNPFPKEAPLYIRADLYEYHFTQNSDDKAWWERKRIQTYLPPLSLDNFKH